MATGWVVCVENEDGSPFPSGSYYLYSAPFRTKGEGEDWAAALSNCHCLRIEETHNVHPSQLV